MKVNDAKIVTSKTAPKDKTVIWDNGESLMVNRNNKWEEAQKSATEPMVLITWSELKTLRDNGKLIPGTQYRITDYVTTTAQKNTRSAGHQFDIIVTADSENTLNEEARACIHEGDTYFSDAGAKLEAWKIWYCLDNDKARFLWSVAKTKKSISVNAEGMTMAAEYAGTYEYEGTMFHRWDFFMSGEKGSFLTVSENPQFGDTTSFYGIIEQDMLFPFPMPIVSVNESSENEGFGVIYRMIDEQNNDVSYDFKNIQFVRKVTLGKLDLENGTDEFVFTFNFFDESVGRSADLSLNPLCYNNNIKQCDAGLNNIVFLTENTECYSNTFELTCFNITFGDGCSSNTFGDYCTNNTFGENCHSNTLGDNCYSNIFGGSCYRNTFRNNCFNNTFGDNCCSNTFRDDCNSNTFGEYCRSNTFGEGCYSNTLGKNCSSNTFGENCTNNTFGNYCSNNTFGESCQSNTFKGGFNSNTFGDDCNSNTFGHDCYDNTFGHGCSSNTLGDNCSYNSFGKDCNSNSFRSSASLEASLKNYCSWNYFDDNCSYNIIWNSDTTGTFNYLRNINIYVSVSGTSSSYNFINIDTVDADYEIQVAKNSKGEIKIYCEADLIA